MAAGSDVTAGVLISSVSQLSRDNTAQGDTLGLFYATSMVDISGTPAEYFIPVSDSPGGGEANINVIAIAQGSSECNISLVVARGDADDAEAKAAPPAAAPAPAPPAAAAARTASKRS